ncbi:MAG TPA: DNA polymerase/3'-5' exonuclease PolX [Thermodesulfobacteriota bacterium]|nr:DNA polymerase/3'-5' exonuclease PolX [Thermodesulfobacteriota bacterium]
MSKNADIANIFSRIASSLQILDENRFKIRAYQNASRNISELSEDLEKLAKSGSLSSIPGVGKDLALKIEEYLSTGKIEYYEKIQKEVPSSLVDLLRIQSMGPKTLSLLYKEFGVKNLTDLEKVLKTEELEKIKGMGKKKIEDLHKGIELMKKGLERLNIGIAFPIAQSIVNLIENIQGTKKTTFAGSLRRMKETIGDIDILTSTEDGEKVIDEFVKLPFVTEVLASGDTKGSVIIENDVQVDLRVVGEDSYGAALLYFTGSKEHNVKLRTMAVKRGLSINEYGIYEGDKKLAGRTEKELYEVLGLPLFPPEIREDRGEFDAAASKSLPNLISFQDIRGDIHCHSNWSDGKSTIEEMARAAKKMGYEYIAITDHSPASRIANGLDIKRLKQKFKEIEEVRKKVKDIKILSGTEVDILSDGSLDYPDKILKDLDVVVASVHSGFKMEKSAMTKRIIRAIKNPYVHILGHPTGRLINEREPYNVDLEEVFKITKQYGKAVELNASYMRLDLNDIHSRRAKDLGIPISINTDAHHTDQLQFMLYGIGTARRGWVEKNDVINCMSYSKLTKWLKQVRDHT